MTKRFKAKKRVINGIKFDSIFESEVYLNYPDLIREPLKLTYERSYIPDFLLVTRSGKAICIECKGVLTVADRSKMRSVTRFNPEIDIRFMFQDANKRVKGTKSTYGQWATKCGFKFCEGTRIPDAWLME